MYDQSHNIDPKYHMPEKENVKKELKEKYGSINTVILPPGLDQRRGNPLEMVAESIWVSQLMKFVNNNNNNNDNKFGINGTRSASKRALLGVPTPIAISLTPADSNLAFASFNSKASSQLIMNQWTELV